MNEQFPADFEKMPGEMHASFACAAVIRSGFMKFMGF
jgi:hypothetical protein